MTTSTRDDRVHPYHARSFVKRLIDIQFVTRQSIINDNELSLNKVLDLINKDDPTGRNYSTGDISWKGIL